MTALLKINSPAASCPRRAPPLLALPHTAGNMWSLKSSALAWFTGDPITLDVQDSVLMTVAVPLSH